MSAEVETKVEVAFGWADRLAAAKPGAERKELYDRYLRSEIWRTRREGALERAGNRCQLCNRSKGLQVHHRTYERVGDEDASDLTVLCSGCHKKHHGTRRKNTKSKTTAGGRSTYRRAFFWRLGKLEAGDYTTKQLARLTKTSPNRVGTWLAIASKDPDKHIQRLSKRKWRIGHALSAAESKLLEELECGLTEAVR